MSQRTDAIYVTVPGGGRYNLEFAPLEALGDQMTGVGLRQGPCVVIMDMNVATSWKKEVVAALQGWKPFFVVLPVGEKIKSAKTLNHLYGQVLQRGIDRRTPVIAVGGGVIGDLAGYAAATLLRGLPLVHVPTSLIAQVDSAIGGKTGINHELGKNLIGAFYQPKVVVVSTDVLQTLPLLEWESGLAEVVKHSLIRDEALMRFLQERWPRIQYRDHATIAELIPWAASIKAEVVSADMHEAGLREILNFGHTFGHAIERVAGYGTFTHGEAVALGMRAALALSKRLHPTARTLDEADSLVRMIPVRKSLHVVKGGIRTLMDAMKYDKKVNRGAVRVVLLRKVGSAYVTGDVTREDLISAWKAAF